MGMETLNPAPYYVRSNRFSKSTKWTREENKWFECAIAIFDQETPDRWINVASLVPGKSEYDVKKQYEELEADISNIEAGLVPTSGYMTSSFTLELVDDSSSFSSYRKRPSMGRSCDQERKKGVPWTEDEHRRFLMGLERHGKGDWRNISRNCVITKTPTQVASHAQKYYARKLSEGKEKRRPSIHDITMVHLTNTTTASDNNRSPSFDKSSSFISEPHMATSASKILLDWNNSSDGAVMVFNSPHANSFMAYPFEIASQTLKLHKHSNHGPYGSGFQIQSTAYQVLG